MKTVLSDTVSGNMVSPDEAKQPKMKLRVKSVETKESLIFSIPIPCSIRLLTLLIAQKLLHPSFSSPMYLSRNKKDVLPTTSPEDSIQSFGVTSGDLIYFSTKVNRFSTAPRLFERPQTLIRSITSKKRKVVDFTSEDNGYGSSVGKVGSSSVLDFLRKVFKEELGDHRDHDDRKHLLLELTVRAVLLESGFVETRPVSEPVNSNSNLSVQTNLCLPTFYYTFPEVIASGRTETVKIKFQSVGNYCRIYGYLVDGTTVHSVVIDKARLVLFAAVVWANVEQVIVVMKETNEVTDIQPKKEVLQSWIKIKDELVLPLLRDLCDKVGLEPPPGFMQLPTDVKLKILESVSDLGLARLSCVCSKLRCLVSSDDELWERRFRKQFGFGRCHCDKRPYKELYGEAWKAWGDWENRQPEFDPMFDTMFF